MGIKSIRIQNFKSIKDSGVIKLSNINVLVGANGSGKSNFIKFFYFLKKIAAEELGIYLTRSGTFEKNGIDNILHFGRRKSNYLSGNISFYCDEVEDGYVFSLIPNDENGLVFSKEEIFCMKNGHLNNYILNSKYKNGEETSLNFCLSDNDDDINKHILNHIDLIKIYHFNDTSSVSNIKTPSMIPSMTGNKQFFLEEDCRNFALFLYNFLNEYPEKFKILEYTINSVAPFFDKFHLVQDKIKGEICLRWVENDADSTIFSASNLSDGTLRFIGLAAILMHPVKPMTIILDEPELGLHPFAIDKLGALIDVASEDCQVIISTQSPELVSQFSANNIIVVEREDSRTTFKRQSEKELKNWGKNYSMGEIWCSNAIGGNPL